MPELPEVESARQVIARTALGRRIVDVDHIRVAMGHGCSSSQQAKHTSGGLTDNFVMTKVSVMSLLSVAEVAGRLGVTTRQVQHLVAHGYLRAPARGLIDETSLDRYLASRPGSRRRAWSQATAWAAVALLSGCGEVRIGPTQRSRLRARLRVVDPNELISLARHRASVVRYAGHASTAMRLRPVVVETTRAAEVLGLARSSSVDGYVAVDMLDSVVAHHGLIRDDNGRFTLRATAMELAVVAELAVCGTVLAGLDLAESLDVRERRVGRGALADALKRFRG